MNSSEAEACHDGLSPDLGRTRGGYTNFIIRREEEKEDADGVYHGCVAGKHDRGSGGMGRRLVECRVQRCGFLDIRSFSEWLSTPPTSDTKRGRKLKVLVNPFSGQVRCPSRLRPSAPRSIRGARWTSKSSAQLTHDSSYGSHRGRVSTSSIALLSPS